MTWVKGKGGVRRWNGPRPPDDPEPIKYKRRDPTPEQRRNVACLDCGTPIHRGSQRCMRHAVEAHTPRPRTPHKTLGVTCDDCGCLLLPGEHCPARLAWAIANAARASWATTTVHYNEQKVA